MRTNPSKKEIAAAIRVLKQAPFLEVQRMGYHFQANNFYSPLNDCDFLSQNPDLWKDRGIPREIDWNKDL